ncbi:sensor histidine kinase [Thiobacter aerophilum]|uniref:Histidine kinase n=1 Tax=Thiobacter aerophilum TaxID=3121275 RepID=A0ABV0EDI7_9BURK
MASINHPHPVTLPNFANLGTILRILVLANVMGLAAALVIAPSLTQIWRALQEVSLHLQPVVLASLGLMSLVNPWLARLPYVWGAALVVAVVTAIAVGHEFLLAHLFQWEVKGDTGGVVALSLLASTAILGYFHMRARILSPAVTEARLQALQARIRPHFLFNSINAVLSLVGSDPRRAERALLDMADLFRVLMGNNRELVTLESELNLSWQYLELEQLRLGNRLKVVWHIDKMPKDALVPPLILQPLLENAVYHGVEPVAEPGEIVVNIYRHRHQVHLVVKNPCPTTAGRHHAGNRMAVQNIRERLALHFDAEATMKAERLGDTYQVHIILPYTRAKNEPRTLERADRG